MLKCKKKLVLMLTLVVFALGGVVACGEDDDETNNDENNVTNADENNEDENNEDENNEDENNEDENNEDENNGVDVSDDTLISELDEDGIATVCGDLETMADEGVSTEQGITASCAGDMVFDTSEDPVQYCNDNYQACIDAGDEESLLAYECFLGEMETDACDATVAEIKACEQEALDALIVLGDQFVCEDLDEDETNEEVEEALSYLFFAGPACAPLEDSCSAYVRLDAE